MPDPQIIVEFMGGPLDGGYLAYPEAPPLALLFPCRPRFEVIDRQRPQDQPEMQYERYEMTTGSCRPGLRYHYMGKDRVEVKA